MGEVSTEGGVLGTGSGGANVNRTPHAGSSPTSLTTRSMRDLNRGHRGGHGRAAGVAAGRRAHRAETTCASSTTLAGINVLSRAAALTASSRCRDSLSGTTMSQYGTATLKASASKMSSMRCAADKGNANRRWPTRGPSWRAGMRVSIVSGGVLCVAGVIRRGVRAARVLALRLQDGVDHLTADIRLRQPKRCVVWLNGSPLW
jgi:hypothetical protein